MFKNLLTAAGIALCLASEALGRANVVGYYPNWIDMPTLSLSKYTHVNFAFAIPASDGSFSFDNQSSMPGIVSNLHTAGTKAIISIGGWTGSNLFSTILKNTTSRTAFLNNIVSYIKKYNLDGVDIDWEYPGREGDTCNIYDPNNDTNNFLSFLQDLRKQLDSTYGAGSKLLTLAVRVEPFDGPDGPIDNVAPFAKVVDYINIMTYDIAGTWNPTTSPNSPLQYAPGQGPQFSVASAIDAWSSAGWPTSQMNLGIPSYGYALTAQKNMLNDPSNMYASISSVAPQGDQDDAPWADPCAGGPAVYSGQWQWKHLRDQGLLTTTKTAASPWVRTWDNATSTPWLFNPNTNIFITYDDPDSIKLKVDYAASKGLAGTMIWSMEMDYNDEFLDVLQNFSNGGSTGTQTTTSPTTSSADTTTVASTTSTPPSTSTSTSGSGPVAGGACSSEGTYQCASASTSASYFICLYSKWVSGSCGSGTVCAQSGSSISCEWPVN
ncbi:hypothetical protein IW140_001242 [Coemansia sp. RSA 1813]|nr:hypothetical protein EV178_001168 [Coemansia sp. RSA 1646]KAJ1772176.1 hypothetical protein LPJ74_001761 [Coemansia sp. RSA 1843]KAJ2091706.1 hypothetical protein IW138_001689 [Coemansia sp. RSA 986]KAJ2216891.1 hypothetical protein EV179_000925 [Coemansia sp. RSA 487]KAJ2571893.1 hypothetical protein IW140_001242 [Coemansia sp. RSA 1813]